MPTHKSTTHRLSRAIALALAAGLGVGAAQVQAATYTVTSTNDPANGTCAPTACSLRQAVYAANSNPGTDTVTFADGVQGTITLTEQDIYISHDIVINGPGAKLLTIDADSDGDGVGESRIFTAYDPNVHVTITGLALTHGVANNTPDGGAISSYGTLNLDDVIIRDSHARFGGGFYADGNATVTDSVISGDTADSRGGGFFSSGQTIVSNSTLSDNTSDADGGGFYSRYDAAVINSTVSGNTSTARGGGFYVIHGSATVTNSTITGNAADQLGGGFTAQSGATVTNSTISGNSSNEDGGGFYVLFDPVVVSNSIIAGNSGTDYDEFGTWTGTFDVSHTLVGGSSKPSVTGGNNGNITGVDPMLEPLQDNGGPTKTMLPGSGSVVIDATACSTAPFFDQRAAPRPDPLSAGLTNRCDLGAVEVASTPSDGIFADGFGAPPLRK